MTSRCQLQFMPGNEVIFCVIPISTSAEYSLPSPAPGRPPPSSAAALSGSSLFGLKSNPPSPVITLIDPRMRARVTTETGGVSPQRVRYLREIFIQASLVLDPQPWSDGSLRARDTSQAPNWTSSLDTGSCCRQLLLAVGIHPSTTRVLAGRAAEKIRREETHAGKAKVEKY